MEDNVTEIDILKIFDDPVGLTRIILNRDYLDFNSGIDENILFPFKVNAAVNEFMPGLFVGGEHINRALFYITDNNKFAAHLQIENTDEKARKILAKLGPPSSIVDVSVGDDNGDELATSYNWDLPNHSIHFDTNRYFFDKSRSSSHCLLLTITNLPYVELFHFRNLEY